MNERIENLRQLAEPPTVRWIGRQLGTPEAATREAVTAAIPLLLSALATQATERHGLDHFHRVLHDAHAGEAVLEDVPTYLGTGAYRHANGLLRQVLGRHPEEASRRVANASGIGDAPAGALLGMLTPMVVAVLARIQRTEGLGDRELAARMQPVLWENAPDLVPA